MTLAVVPFLSRDRLAGRCAAAAAVGLRRGLVLGLLHAVLDDFLVDLDGRHRSPGCTSARLRTCRSSLPSGHRTDSRRCASRRRTRSPRRLCASISRAVLEREHVGRVLQVLLLHQHALERLRVEAERGAALQALLVGVEVDVLEVLVRVIGRHVRGLGDRRIDPLLRGGLDVDVLARA